MNAGHLPLRAEIVESKDPQIKLGRIIINAPTKMIFDILANPKMHATIDGSNTVRSNFSGPERLHFGATFGMRMFLKIPYPIKNTVVIFNEEGAIAWRHFHRHVWKFELRALSPNQTEVIETFDGRPALSQRWLSYLGAYEKNQVAILKTLVRLKQVAESR